MVVKKTIRVVLADDHPMVRQGIRRILEKNSDIHIVGEAGTGTEALCLVYDLKPDVLLLDIEMPALKGDHVARQLRTGRVPVSIVILSTCDDEHFIEQLLRIGVDGYLIKSESPSKIRETVQRVSRNHALAIMPLLVYMLPKIGWALIQAVTGMLSNVNYL